MPLKYRVATFVFFAACFCFQFYVQTQGIIFHDILWSFEIGKRLYAGKLYAKDYFETNPPLLYYFHGFFVLVSNFIKSKTIYVYVTFISVMALLSLYISHIILKKITIIDKTTLTFSFICQCVVFSILLNIDYGQKEMLMMVMTLPFFWTSILRIENKTLRIFYRITISILAGIGLAFKPPYFYLALFLNEAFISIKLKKWRQIYRIEIIIIVLCFLCYLIACSIISPSYLTDVLPTIKKSYVNQGYLPFNTILQKSPIVSFAIISVFYIIVRQLPLTKEKNLRLLLDFWFSLSLGFAISFILQNKGWHYQAVPLFATNFFLMSLSLLQALRYYKTDFVAKSLITLSTLLFAGLYYIYPLVMLLDVKMACNWKNECGFYENIQHISNLSVDKTFYVFSTKMEASYFIYYGKLSLKSRYASLWPLPAILNPHNPYHEELKRSTEAHILQDLQKYKPKMVLVARENNDYLRVKGFNFIGFMQGNKTFQKIWRNYTFKESAELVPQQPKHFDIYIRNPQ